MDIVKMKPTMRFLCAPGLALAIGVACGGLAPVPLGISAHAEPMDETDDDMHVEWTIPLPPTRPRSNDCVAHDDLGCATNNETAARIEEACARNGFNRETKAWRITAHACLKKHGIEN